MIAEPVSALLIVGVLVAVAGLGAGLADVLIGRSLRPDYELVRRQLEALDGVGVTEQQKQQLQREIDAVDVRVAAIAVPDDRGPGAHLWRGTPWRLIPVAATLVPLVALAVDDERPTWLVLTLVALLLVSYLVALAGASGSLAARRRDCARLERDRVEVVELLEEISRPSRRPVAGLGDRVRRALKILGEKQGGPAR